MVSNPRPDPWTTGLASSASPTSYVRPQPLSMEQYVEILSADYPLIDTTLILSLLSDFDDPSSHLVEIRDQLGILEATLVPDTLPDVGARNGTVEGSAGSTTDLSESLGTLQVTGHDGPTASESSKSSRYPSSKTQPTSISMSKSTSTSSIISDGQAIEEGTELAVQVDLLKSLFAGVSTKRIKSAVLTEPSLPAAIDHLLSLELIRQVEQEGAWPGEDAEGSSSLLAEGSLPYESQSKSRRKKKSKSTAVPLVDTLQRRSTPSARPSSRSITPSGPSSNAWGTVASLSAYLADLLQTPQSHFLSYFHSPIYHSALSAIRAALVALPPVKTENDQLAILQDLYGFQLTDHPFITADLEICARVTDDVSIIMDLMDLMAEVSQWPGDDDVIPHSNGVTSKASTTPSTPLLGSTSMTPTSSADSLPGLSRPAQYPDRLTARPKKPSRANGVAKIVPGSQASTSALSHPTAMDSFGQPSSFAPLFAPKPAHGSAKQVHPLNWRTVTHVRTRPDRSHHPLSSSIPAYARGSTPHDPTPGSLYRRQTTSAEAQLYYSNAEKERAKRADAIRAAATHFSGSAISGGKAVNVVVAGHYASQAREAEARAKEWEMKAARSVISSQLHETGNGIDLHHLTVEEGTVVALEMVRKWWDQQSRGQPSSRGQGGGSGLVVVTGKGRHSKGQRGILGPAVAGALRRDGWRVEEGVDRGYLVVKGRV